MNLTNTLVIAQLISICVILPVSAFRVWRRIDQRLTAQDIKLTNIDAQFHRNGGSTLRDQNDRIEKDLSRLTGRFDQHIVEGS